MLRRNLCYGYTYFYLLTCWYTFRHIPVSENSEQSIYEYLSINFCVDVCFIFGLGKNLGVNCCVIWELCASCINDVTTFMLPLAKAISRGKLVQCGGAERTLKLYQLIENLTDPMVKTITQRTNLKHSPTAERKKAKSWTSCRGQFL